MPNHEAFPFLRLPPEIRLQIYENVLSIEDEAGVEPDSRSLEENKLSILKVNRLVRQEAFEVLFSSTAWVIFRIHHSSHEHAVRGEQQSRYHVPELQFLGREPHLSALLRHQYLLVDVGEGAGLYKHVEMEEMITTLVFPYHEKRFDYFCLDLWKRCDIYPFATLQLSAMPWEREGASWALLQSFMPVTGFENAVCRGFDETCGEMLQESLTAKLESWHDICRILYHYHESGKEAMEDLDSEGAVHKYGMAALVLSHFAGMTDLHQRLPSSTHQEIRVLARIGIDIRIDLASAYNLYVDSERYLDNDKLPVYSAAPIEHALEALRSAFASALDLTDEQHMKATYHRGIALRNKAEYGSTYLYQRCQKCRRRWGVDHFEKAAVNFYLTVGIATHVDNAEANETVVLAETALTLLEERFGWTREETDRRAHALANSLYDGEQSDSEQLHGEDSDFEHSDCENGDLEIPGGEQSAGEHSEDERPEGGQSGNEQGGSEHLASKYADSGDAESLALDGR